MGDVVHNADYRAVDTFNYLRQIGYRTIRL